MSRLRKMLAGLIVCFSFVFCFETTATACPMCRAANESEEDDRLPRAYMYSILFMLAVPASLASAMGFSLYRVYKREQFPDDWDLPEDESHDAQEV